MRGRRFAGTRLRGSWQPTQERFSPGWKFTKERIRWISMKSLSRAWRKMLRSAGTVKCAEPSGWTGTMPCSTFTLKCVYRLMAIISPGDESLGWYPW